MLLIVANTQVEAKLEDERMQAVASMVDKSSRAALEAQKKALEQEAASAVAFISSLLLLLQ